ncbi:tachykinin-3 isoform X1 [Oncorhynchus tshawytscha]|uniref:tachykinin-3 isoform X1 n=1 Tax=Oncorhynchus tshawytscha TaxID=74940 RepID=UPI001C3E76F0|nr:tachykinin-3 isoform X1 [Oncorhynchus tshawytscha]
MKNGLLLVALFLVMKLRSSQSSCEEPAAGSLRSTADSEDTPGLENLKRTILKRYNDLDYDSFVGLMGRRGADIYEVPPSPHKREMDDVFVGLMGRRNLEQGNMRPLRKEAYPETRRGGLFFNKCRLRCVREAFALPYNLVDSMHFMLRRFPRMP